MCKFCSRLKLSGGDEGGLGGDGADGLPLTHAERKDAELCPLLRKRRIPVLILTGFLGAGKTTLLNSILKVNAGRKKLAVIENEIGSISLDDKLVQRSEKSLEEVIVLSDGCLCCRVRNDLIGALQEIVGEDGNGLDGLIIELSGMSAMGPVVNCFYSHRWVQEHLGLVCCACVLDASQTRRQLSQSQELSASCSERNADERAIVQEQLGLCDVALLNKADTLRGEAEELLSMVSRFNPTVLTDLCSLRENGLEGLSSSVSRFFSGEEFLSWDALSLESSLAKLVKALSVYTNTKAAVTSGHTHGPRLGSCSLEEGEGPVSMAKVMALIESHAGSVDADGTKASDGSDGGGGDGDIAGDNVKPRLLRCKGIAWTGGIGAQSSFALVQGAFRNVQVENIQPAQARVWKLRPRTQLVFIGVGFGRKKVATTLARELRKCVVHAHGGPAKSERKVDVLRIVQGRQTSVMRSVSTSGSVRARFAAAASNEAKSRSFKGKSKPKARARVQAVLRQQSGLKLSSTDLMFLDQF